MKPQPWEDIPDTLQYSEVVEWEYNSDIEPLGHQTHPTSIATVSEEMVSVISQACTIIRLECAYCGIPTLFHSRSDHRIFGSYSQLHQDGATTPSCQDKIVSRRVSTNNKDGGANLSLDTSMSIGQNEFNNVCYSSCTPLLL